MKIDNKGKNEKVYFRHLLLDELKPLAVMETNGGSGKLYNVLYRNLKGVVFEKDTKKAEALAKQRPNWSVYETDCVSALSSGIGFHIPINYIDIDPYGDAWPIIRSVFKNKDKLPDTWGMVVNDGLRRFLMVGRAWKIKQLRPYLEQYGNYQVAEKYKEICRDMMNKLAEDAGMKIIKWAIGHGGHGGQMTHFLAVLQKF